MTKKKTAPAKKSTKNPVKWFDHARKLPVELFHTTVGPMIGRVEKAPSDSGQFRVRLYAPAIIQVGFVGADKADPSATVMQQRIVFQPIALVETHIDLSTATPYGRSPVPESLLPAYDEYFEKFVNGDYGLRRVVAKVEQGAPHVASIETPVAEPPVENDQPAIEEPSGPQSDDSHVS
jgi:hypothetical protein